MDEDKPFGPLIRVVKSPHDPGDVIELRSLTEEEVCRIVAKADCGYRSHVAPVPGGRGPLIGVAWALGIEAVIAGLVILAVKVV